jgi:enoyl-CoA hydratase
MPHLTLERAGADGTVAVVTFRNPPRGTMDSQTEAELPAILDAIERDPAIRVAIVTGGQAGVFIRHYSVQELEKRARMMKGRGLAFDTTRAVPEPSLHASFRRIESIGKPFIAAINGIAMGGGFELALCCDIRLAEAGLYSLGLPEINIGLLPGAGGTQKLPLLIGQSRALELMLRGKTLSPRRALAYGIVSECTPGPVLPRAIEIARELAAKSPKALAHIKRLARQAGRVETAKGLADERTLFCDLMVSDEALGLMGEMNAGKRDIRDR